MVQDPREVFSEEANELLSDFESALLALEDSPGDKDLMGRLFRAVHTLKGAGSMFGFDSISNFTHDVESVLDYARKGRIPVSRRLIDLCLAAKDQVNGMLRSPDARDPDPERARGIIEGLRECLPDGDSALRFQPGQTLEKKTEGAPETGLLPPAASTYRIHFQPQLEIFRSGNNPLLLLDELRGMGDASFFIQVGDIPAIENIDPEGCYLGWDVFLTTTASENDIRGVFIFVEDQALLSVDLIAASDTLDEAASKRLGDILLDRGDIRPGALDEMMSRKKLLGEMLVESGLTSEEKVQSALLEQEHLRQIKEKAARTDAIASVRVPAARLDVLVDLVGELVTLQARLNQLSSTLNDNRLLALSEEAERLTVSLRDNTMSLRMLPIGTLFSKFQRLVRDLSASLDKNVELVTEGAETELDKTVIERVSDPLVHMVRNCVDHGIETPEARRRAGKEGTGKVHLTAYHSGANVVIRISDDGAGVNREAVRAKAVEQGLISPHAELEDQEILQLLFAPGFSTARSVSSVSGRGVGMDVVKKNIEELGGGIEVWSQAGRGTSVTLKIPLTLAIIEGFLVRIADGFFVFPLSAVEECVELGAAEFDRSRRRNLIHVRGEIVPYIYLRDYLGIFGEPPPVQQVVVTDADGGRIGLVVDHVIGSYQTVIKSLGRYCRGVEDVSGATILGDGTVALILDIPRILRNAERAHTNLDPRGAWPASAH